MTEFSEWIKKTYGKDIPADYADFLSKGLYEKGNVGEYSFTENGTTQHSDIHSFLKPAGRADDNIRAVYKQQLRYGIISDLHLPFAQDSGGNFLCINMSDEKYGSIEFLPHDYGSISPFFVSKSFGDLMAGLNSYCENSGNTDEGAQKSENNADESAGGVRGEAPCKDDYALEDKPFPEDKFTRFVSENKLKIPEEYIDYMRRSNGMLSGRTVETRDIKTGMKITVIVPLLLSCDRVMEMYRDIQAIKKTAVNYLPVAITTNSRFFFVLKVKGRAPGAVYLYDGIMNEMHLVFDSFTGLAGAL